MQNETFALYKSFISIRNFIHYIEFILEQKNITYRSRDMLKLCLGRGNAVINDFTRVLGNEALEAFKKEMESDTMLYDAIWDKLAQLDEKQRWEIENNIDKMILKNKEQKDGK